MLYLLGFCLVEGNRREVYCVDEIDEDDQKLIKQNMENITESNLIFSEQ